MKFNCFGHKNILGTHRMTFEFTKDSNLTRRGDCIIGVDSDFDPDIIKKFIKDKVSKGDKGLTIIMRVADLVVEVNAEINPEFNDCHEVVIRKSDFISERTLGIRADKACIDFPRGMVENLKDPGKEIIVELV